MGGSIGIAIVATIVERTQVRNVSTLGEHVNPFNPAAVQRMTAAKQFMMSQGVDPAMATKRAAAMTMGAVHRQATITSYVDTFQLLSVIFLSLVPLILLMRKPSGPSGPVAAH